MDLHELVAAGPTTQTARLRAGDVSATELARATVERIDAESSRLNAVVELLGEEATAMAAAADRRRSAGEDGPLLGVPIAVKNDLDVAGHVTGLGSRAMNRKATTDADLVARLRELGAVVVASTALPELAVYGFTESAATGVTRNPHDTGHTPGGSSGGSAALVAAGAVGLATASDGAGSIRIPAACCGLVGFKPTHGTVPSSGGWIGLSTQGGLTRTVADSALYLDAVGTFATSLTSAAAGGGPEPLRIGLSTSASAATRAEPLDPEVTGAMRRAADALAAAGHDVREVEIPYGLDAKALTVRYLAGIREVAGTVDDPALLERRTRSIARLGRPFGRGAIDAACRAGHRWGATVHDTAGVDVFLTPVMSGPALPVGHFDGRGALRTVLSMNAFYPYTAQWNHAGTPAVSLPAGTSRSGLPLAVQLIARRGDDADLMALAAQLEAGLGTDG
ncbi:Amidase [Aeromicrobium marinum DSM 15272]|uniref:Amidase n=1 Tax=Aeromicrobium marinum DSM 15272 TaxID=585531 RepID=E2SBL6_9ACTN|nr:amidase family protein [Aeromicrobium marinum]EFQ83762.1 Amidase [Aeromicrobium marinum DSM 15272]